jgi:hypothetical protein
MGVSSWTSGWIRTMGTGCCKLLRGKEKGYGKSRWVGNGGLEDGFVAKRMDIRKSRDAGTGLEWTYDGR